MNSLLFQIKNWRGFWKRSFLLLLTSILSCTTLSVSNKPDKISTFQKQIYTEGKSKPSRESVKEIQTILQAVIDGVLKEDLNILSEVVHPKKGIFVDLKAGWTYEKLINEIHNENSYFEIYFFDRKKLIKQKKSSDVETVKELLLKSGGLDVDYFFQDDSSCELKLSYHKNGSYRTDLNNPYFIKIEDKWYIYRLF